MELATRISALVTLGEVLTEKDEYREAVMKRAEFHNQWFSLENQEAMFQAIAGNFLDASKLRKWLESYQLAKHTSRKTVGLVMAGNIPLVGFHDLITIFVAGHKSQIKLSEKDQYLVPYIIKKLREINPETHPYFEIVEKLQGFDAIIATGSNNSARYFEAYFGRHPNIIRKNRNGVAILTGNESQEELLALSRDVFQYFGLGCRNVSKIYVPDGYKFDSLLEALHENRQIVLHSKYKNNFDYNYALYVLNQEPYLANGCILLIQNTAIPSRIASLHYEFYSDQKALERELANRSSEIQCLIAQPGFLLENVAIPFGKSQEPELWDYADDVDTMAFLQSL